MSSVPTAGVRWRAATYDRLSTAIQAQTAYTAGKDGTHLKECRAAAERDGCVIVLELDDTDSGAEWELPGILRVLDAARRREFDILYVSDSSRFARSHAKHLTYVEQLRKCGVRVVFLDLPAVDETETGDFMLSVLGAKNQLERAIIRKRTMGARREKAARGMVVGAGPAPYGYRYRREEERHRKRLVTVGLEPDPETAPIVERIYNEGLTCSVVEIAAALQRDGVPVPAAWRPTPKRPLPTVWSTKTVHRILTDPVYRGEWTYGGIVVPLDPSAAIVTAERQAAVAERLAARSTRRAPRGPADDDPFILRGLLACGHCRNPLSVNTTARPGGGVYRRYTCGRSIPSRCERYGWQACPGPLPMLLAADATGHIRGIEDLAWEAVVQLKSSPEELDRLIAARATADADVRERWVETVGAIDAQIVVQERRLRRAREEKQDYERGTEGYCQYAENEGKAAHALVGLREERAAVAARQPAVWSPEAIAAIKGELGFLAGNRAVVKAGLDRDRRVRELRAMGPSERRRELERLEVRGAVRADAGGAYRVGRSARVDVVWEMLGSVCGATGFLKLVLLRTSAGLALAGFAGHPNAA